MITGERAYPQKTLVDLVQKKTRGDYRPVESCGVPVPKELAHAVGRAMALNAKDRFETAADFAYELFRIFRQESDRAPQDVVSRYIKDPASIGSVAAKKHASSLIPILAFSALGLSVLILVAAILFFVMR
jgi:hypothetical protein